MEKPQLWAQGTSNNQMKAVIIINMNFSPVISHWKWMRGMKSEVRTNTLVLSELIYLNTIFHKAVFVSRINYLYICFAHAHKAWGTRTNKILIEELFLSC